MKTLNRTLWGMAALLIMVMASCTKDSDADAGDLLKTVPSDASAVAVVNLGSLLEKAGCEVNGSEIKPSEDARKWLASIKKESDRAASEAMLNGESGIEPSALVVFMVGYKQYFTGIVADPAKFKVWAEKQEKSKFVTTDGVELCGNTALKGNQFWVNLGSGAVSAEDVNHYVTLSEEQSFLSNKSAPVLSVINDDIEGWGNIAGLLNTGGMGFQERAMFQVAMQTVYEDAADFTFGVRFNKGSMEFKGSLLNSKGKPAKFALPSGKVDVKTVESIGGSAAAVVALSVPGKLIEKLRKEASSKSASVFSVYLNALSSLDGTVAFAVSPDARGISGVLTTNGNSSGDLMALLRDFGMEVTLDGKMIKVNRGAVSGDAPVAEMAGGLKGSLGGVVICPSPQAGDRGVAEVVKRVNFTLMPENGSVGPVLEVVTTQPEVNSFLTLLNLAISD